MTTERKRSKYKPIIKKWGVKRGSTPYQDDDDLLEALRRCRHRDPITDKLISKSAIIRAALLKDSLFREKLKEVRQEKGDKLSERNATRAKR